MNPLAAKILKRVGFGLAGTFAYSLVRDQLRFRSLRGAVVLISGGSRGLGLVLAKQYAAEGASICLLARDDDELRRAQNIIFSQFPETIVHIKVCDSTKLPQVEEAVAFTLEMFGKIDVVVNCAGTITSMPIENATKKDFVESLEAHFWAPFNVIRTCLPH
ncbi:MAG: SDR family NAD(P)-dependent oxidoreductase, partial [Bdellovibrio sp.]|nr:SDR family NAD(P)-dependent oxidoreductase [Bdellovibrio sp.]